MSMLSTYALVVLCVACAKGLMHDIAYAMKRHACTHLWLTMSHWAESYDFKSTVYCEK